MQKLISPRARLAKPVRAAPHSLHVVACGSRSNSTQGAHCGAPAGGGGLARRRYNTSIRITQILHSLVHRRIVDVAAGGGSRAIVLMPSRIAQPISRGLMVESVARVRSGRTTRTVHGATARHR